MIFEQTFRDYFKKINKFISDEDVSRIFKGIVKICQRNNLDFGDIKYITKGGSSVVLECNGKIIKFVPFRTDMNITDYVSSSNLILKPIDELPILIEYSPQFKYNMIITLADKLNTFDEISDAQMLDFARALVSDGYIWLDIKKDNLAYDDKGKIKLIDYGELFNRKYDNELYKHIETFKSKYESIEKTTKKRNFFKR